MAVELATAYVSILPTTKGLGKAISSKIVPQAQAVGMSAGSRMGAAIVGTVKKVVKGGAIAAGVAVGAAIMSGFKAAVQRQTAEKVLGGLYGSAQKAAKMMTDLRNISKNSPIDYSGYVDAAQSLAYAGIEGNKATGILKNVGYAIVAAGGDSTKMQQAMGGVMKAVNNGGIAMMDSLSMISESGVPILSGLAEKFGTTTDQIKKMASKGKISIDDVMDVLQKGTGKTFQQMIKGGKAASQSFGNQWKIAKDNIVNAVGDVILPMLDKLAPAIKPVADAIVAGIGKLPGIADAVVKSFSTWGPLLGSIVGGLIAYQVTVKAIAVATAAWNVVTKAARIATAGWAVQQRLLNTAMRANPIGLIITAITLLVAGFILAYKKVGWFRNAVNAAWAGIKIAVAAVVDWFKNVVWPALQVVWNAIATGAKWLWQNVMVPVWNGIKTAVMAVVSWFQTYVQPVISGAITVIGNIFNWLYTYIIKPVFTGIKIYITAWWTVVKAIFNAVVWFVKTVLGPIFTFFKGVVSVAFQLIKVAAQMWWASLQIIFKAVQSFIKKYLAPVFTWLYNSVIKPVFNWIKNLITLWWNSVRATFTAVVNFVKSVLGPVFTWFKNSIIIPVWNGIKTAIHAAWAFIKNYIFTPIKSFIENVLGPAFTWFKNNVIVPVWNGIKTTIHNVWAFIRDKIFNPLKHAVKETLPAAFRAGKDAIGKAWEKLQDVAKKPVRFVVDTVINKGVIDNFNKIAGSFGVKKIDRVSLPKGFKTGGHIMGPGSGTSDSIPAWLSNGEFVVNARATRKFLPLLHAINGEKGVGYRQMQKVGKKRGLTGIHDYLEYGGEKLSGFKAGGEVSPLMKKAQDWARAQVGKPYIWGGVGPAGYDCSGFMSAITNVLTGRNPHHRLFATGSFSKNRGAAGFQPGLKSAFSIGVSPNTGSGIGHTAGTLGGMNVESYGHHGPAVGSGARGATDSLFPWKFYLPMAGGQFISGGGGAGGVDIMGFLNPFEALKKLVDKVPGSGAFTDLMKGGAKKVIDWPINWIKDHVGSLIGGAGQVVDGAVKGAVKAQVKQAAMLYGWGFGEQWKAIDWLVEHESGWNMHAKNPTSSAEGLFQKMTSIHGPVEKTAAGQAGWGLKYIKSRYGTPTAAKAFWQSHHWYRNGGYVAPKLYDKGGVLEPGVSLVANKTRKPEYILPAHITDALLNQGVSETREAPLVGVLNALDMDDAFRKLDRERRKREALAVF